MTRLAAGVSYDGTNFRGWQHQQPTVPTVQAAVETALSRVAASPVEVYVAGRTDAGVHAVGQVIHFETTAQRPLHGWLFGANSYLPPTVSLDWVQAVPPTFHARFAARRRRYRYLVLNRRNRSALWHGRATLWHVPLDAGAMHQAAQVLVGEQDFSAYRAVGCQARHPIREIFRLAVVRQGDWVWLDIEANAFLHHMVRNIMGVLLAIGGGERPRDWAATVLASRDRNQGGVTAPPDGLYLTGVDYDPPFDLPPAIPWGVSFGP